MEVDKIKKECAIKITDRITTYKNLILESFVKFYGEGYRDIITTRFNDISFCIILMILQYFILLIV